MAEVLPRGSTGRHTGESTGRAATGESTGRAATGEGTGRADRGEGTGRAVGCSCGGLLFYAPVYPQFEVTLTLTLILTLTLTDPKPAPHAHPSSPAPSPQLPFQEFPPSHPRPPPEP